MAGRSIKLLKMEFWSQKTTFQCKLLLKCYSKTDLLLLVLDVHLIGCEVSDVGATTLAEALHSNTTLEELGLSANLITDVQRQQQSQQQVFESL